MDKIILKSGEESYEAGHKIPTMRVQDELLKIRLNHVREEEAIEKIFAKIDKPTSSDSIAKMNQIAKCYAMHRIVYLRAIADTELPAEDSEFWLDQNTVEMEDFVNSFRRKTGC